MEQILLVAVGAAASLVGGLFLHQVRAGDERRERLMTAYADLFAAVHQAMKSGDWSPVGSRTLAVERREPDDSLRDLVRELPWRASQTSEEIWNHLDVENGMNELAERVRTRYLRPPMEQLRD